MGCAEKRLRDLFGGEAADFAQRERDLRVRRQGGMAAGKDEAQPVVLDAFTVPGRSVVGDRFDLLGDVVDGGAMNPALEEHLASRIQDAEARVVITADVGYDRGKTINLKGVVDDAVQTCASDIRT